MQLPEGLKRRSEVFAALVAGGAECTVDRGAGRTSRSAPPCPPSTEPGATPINRRPHADVAVTAAAAGTRNGSDVPPFPSSQHVHQHSGRSDYTRALRCGLVLPPRL